MLGFSTEDVAYDPDGLEEKLTLDSSQLPRLVNLRIDSAKQCDCDRCGDLLDKLQNKTKILEHNHKAEGPALTYWTLVHKDGNPLHFENQLDQKMKLTPKELTRHDEFIDSLVEVEHAWQRSQRSACVNEDNDDYWMKHYVELKKNVAEQRKYDCESLDELRSEVLQNEESPSSATTNVDM